MKSRRSERIAFYFALVPTTMLALLGIYMLSGPILHRPVVVTVPDSVMHVWCGDFVGCYKIALPDIIVMTQKGVDNPSTLPHEMLHYNYPSWSECEVSTYLYSTTGLQDGYHKNGDC